MLGLPYTGIELRPPQKEANERQWARIGQYKAARDKPAPKWVEGDALDTHRLLAGQEFDLLFSCPPYGDLEIYSDDPRDLSNMGEQEFFVTYHRIIRRTVKLLRDNRFACFVVGDYRNKAGFYYNFPGTTIDYFMRAGMELYNEAVLVTSVGSLPIRVGRQFTSGRKLGKGHQNVLVFYKGDPKAIKEIYGGGE
jgi:DNA modification methylase